MRNLTVEQHAEMQALLDALAERGRQRLEHDFRDYIRHLKLLMQAPSRALSTDVPQSY